MTVTTRIDQTAPTFARAESVAAELPSRSEPRVVLTALPSRQPRLTPAISSNTLGLAVPTAAGGVGPRTAASRRVQALVEIAEATRRDVDPEAWSALAKVFEAEIAEAQAAAAHTSLPA